MASDFANVSDSMLAALQWVARQIIFRKFQQFVQQGTGNPMEVFSTPQYQNRAAIIWIEPTKTYDQQRDRRSEPESLNIATPFQVQGASPGVQLEDATVISAPYGGDQIIWNGKVWTISDIVDPVQAGPLGPVAFWRTQIRYAGKTGQGVSPRA